MSLSELSAYVRAETGLDFRFGLELEFLLTGPSARTVIKRLERPEIYALCKERAENQYEMVFPHTTDVETLALVAEEARSYAAAMAKSHGCELVTVGLPAGGKAVQGLHVHVNAERDGENAFVGPGGDKLFKACVAGMLERMPACVKYLVPAASSYRRFRLNSPMSPSRIAWGIDNRSCALRVPPSAPAAKRVEYRPPTPDADIEAVLRCVLLSAASGAARADAIECPSPVYGNAYDPQYGLRPFPVSLEGAKAISDALIDGPFIPDSGDLTALPAGG